MAIVSKVIQSSWVSLRRGVIKGGNGFSLESISSLVCLQKTDFAFWIQMSSNEILSRQITLHDFTHDISSSITGNKHTNNNGTHLKKEIEKQPPKISS